jgi:hypothetical protein
MTDVQTAKSPDLAAQAFPTPPPAAPVSALTRDRALGLIQGLLADGIITGVDLRAYVPSVEDPLDPEAVRQDYEAWFRSAGIETVTGRRFTLGPCPFTREELADAAVEGWIPVVSPTGLRVEEVAAGLRFDTWATSDPLVTAPPEEEDFWFLTPAALVPEDGNTTAREVRQTYDRTGHLGMSLQRYMIVAARLRHLTGQLPDYRWWVWIMRGRYDRSGFLIAGFDPNQRFSVHAWMPNFQAAFVGHRPIRVSPRIAAAPDSVRSS